jgi:hypothetical protein
MSMDPRRILEDAAQCRSVCELMARGGGVQRARVVRVEKGGIVVSTDERCFDGGEDLKVWLPVDDQCYRFEASVIRAGVPVPDRGPGGVLLGFIDRFGVADEKGADAGHRLQILPPSGPPVSLLKAPARLLQLTVDGLVFSMPLTSKLVFVQSGTVDVELAARGQEVGRVSARVRTLSPGDDYLLYDLEFEEICDAERHRELVQILAESVD